MYTDVGLFTSSPSIGGDVSELFNALTGYSRQRTYRTLIVAPIAMRQRRIELIEARSGPCRRGPLPARLIAKMNALVRVRRSSTRSIAPRRPGLKSISSSVAFVACVPEFPE